MTREQILQAIRVEAERLADEAGKYKTHGDHATYGPYQQGRSDMADEVCGRLTEIVRQSWLGVPEPTP